MSTGRFDDAVDRLLEQHRRALADDLDTVLDVEAGLHEVLLQSRHSVLVDDLDTVLDVEAGLTAILPATPLSATRPGPSPQEQDPAATEQSLGLVGPQIRLTVRCHPDVVTASRNLAHANVLALTDAGTLAHALALDLADAVAGVLDRAGAVARARARARALDPALVLALDHVLDLARSLNPAHVDVLDLVYAHAHALIRALDRARVLTEDLDLGHARDIDSALFRARVLDADLAHDLARAHTGVIIDLCVAEVRQAVGEVLGRELPTLDEDSMRAFLDDFTTADLRTADLSGIDIEGVRWSESGTLWPAEVDVEALKARSEEVGTGSGVYVVRSGLATTRDFADRV